MGGRVKQPQLNKADAILFAEQSGASLIVYYVRGRYHMIHSKLAHKISALAKIVHRTGYEEIKTFRYDEGNYVREEDVDCNGQIVNRRLTPRYNNKKGSRSQAQRRRSA